MIACMISDAASFFGRPPGFALTPGFHFVGSKFLREFGCILRFFLSCLMRLFTEVHAKIHAKSFKRYKLAVLSFLNPATIDSDCRMREASGSWNFRPGSS